MDAAPQLLAIATAMNACKLEAVMIGNAAAALQGAPVTTLDFDFMFRPTPANRSKLKKLATLLEATVFRPYYPVSGLFRVVDDSGGLQLDFMPTISGIRSFATLRARAKEVRFGDCFLLVADLADIIRSKRSANRPKGRIEKAPSRRAVLLALKRESDLDLQAQIERLLALPMNKRTHFLRVRLPGGGSAL